MKEGQKKRIDLTQGSLSSHLLRMTPPMIAAFFATMAFNLADTWFVSKLGTDQLAAMGFSFPLVMLYFSVSFGLALGVSSAVSQALGRGDERRVRQLTTYALLLTLVVMISLMIIGQSALDPLLNRMGAEPSVAPYVIEYMRCWLWFLPFIMLPMVGNNAIRATGDTLRPGLIMGFAALANVCMDPLFIFGWGPIPAMGMHGAALATGLARTMTLVLSLSLLQFRCHLLTFKWFGWRTIFSCWKTITFVAAPSALTNFLHPITGGIIILMVSNYGKEAVAAVAAGQRIESMLYVVPMAAGTALIPIIGQNWGARSLTRIREVWVKTLIFCSVYSFVCVLISIPGAGLVAPWFSGDSAVCYIIERYLWIILPGSLLLHAIVHTSFAFNAIEKPLHASMLMVLRMLVFVLPLAWLGRYFFGLYGIFGGMALGHTLCGGVSIAWYARCLRRAESR